jgi:hypothetical protein
MSIRWGGLRPGLRRRTLEQLVAALEAEVAALRAVQAADEVRLLAAARPWLLRRAAAFEADRDHLLRPAHLWREGGSACPRDAEARAKVARMVSIELQCLANDELPAIMRFDLAACAAGEAGAA